MCFLCARLGDGSWAGVGCIYRTGWSHHGEAWTDPGLLPTCGDGGWSQGSAKPFPSDPCLFVRRPRCGGSSASRCRVRAASHDDKAFCYCAFMQMFFLPSEREASCKKETQRVLETKDKTLSICHPACSRWIQEGFFPMQEIGPPPPRAPRPGEGQQCGRNGGGRAASSKPRKMKKPAAVQKTLKKPAAKWSHDLQIWGEKIEHGVLTAWSCGVLCLLVFFGALETIAVWSLQTVWFGFRPNNEPTAVWSLEIFCWLFSNWRNKQRAVSPLYLILLHQLRATQRCDRLMFWDRNENKQRWTRFNFMFSCNLQQLRATQRCDRFGFYF